MSISVPEYRALMEKRAKPSKYGNTPTTTDGMRFDSKLEARHYALLKNLWHMGKIKWFIRQVPFDLEGCTYRADFLVIPAEGPPEIDECKGFMTAIAALKLKQVQARYGIKVNIIRKSPKC